MSISDPTRPTIWLTALADAGTDIFIIDSNFRLVARGVSRLSQPVGPGIYKVKFRAGSTIAERLTVVDLSTGSVEVRCPPLTFSSSIPLAGTRKTHEYHMGNAEALSRKVHERLGQGAQIFVFARTWTNAADSAVPALQPPTGFNPATGLTLHALDGRVLTTFENLGQSDCGVRDPWAGCNLDVEPGAYRLRLHVPGIGDLEQLVFAPAAWQTQIFLLQHDYGQGAEPTFRADLANASILLARIGSGFVAHDESSRTTELARLALQNRRTAVPRDLLERMLNSKFDNPMLGIYGAHALLSSEVPDRSLLRVVVSNLIALVPNHPDVEAIALYLEQSAGSEQYATPTMLRNSWSIVVDKATDRPDLVPAGSLASRVSTCIWGDSPWLIWLADRLEDDAPLAESQELLWEWIAQIARIARTLSPESGRSLERGATLNDFEMALFTEIARRGQPAPLRSPRSEPVRDQAADFSVADFSGLPGGADLTPSRDDEPKSTILAMARALGVPPSAVQGTVGSLLSKLHGTIQG